eukprot:jgi/Antlo1/1677/2412
MMGKEQDKMNADDIVDILHVMDYLGIRKEWEWACYGKLARKTMEDYKEAAGSIEMFIKKAAMLWKFLLSHVQNLLGLHVERKTTDDCKETAVEYIKKFREKAVKENIKPQSFLLYTQHLLRLYAEEHGMRLTVDEKRKTLDLWRTNSKKEQRENRTEDWELRLEVSDEYRRQTEVQRVAEVLMEVMDTAVRVDVEEWKPEDKIMVERIISKAKKTELRIKSSKVEPGAIAQHMRKLKNNVVELGVSENHLSDKDWKTIGEITSIKRLNMSRCNLQAGSIAKHMQKLDLVELNVSEYENLIEIDWITIGRMTKLKRLNTRGCKIQEEQFSRYLARLRYRIY